MISHLYCEREPDGENGDKIFTVYYHDDFYVTLRFPKSDLMAESHAHNIVHMLNAYDPLAGYRRRCGLKP